MAGPNPIALAVPVFFVAILLEAAAARWLGRSVYRFPDAIANLSCGLSSQVLDAFYKATVFSVYVLLAERVAPMTLPIDAWWTWLFAIIGVDFGYYWWHRATHEVNALWASHVVHHHSEDYNLAVALRQSATSGLTSWPFYLPLAVLGVPPLVAATCIALNTLYQFWIHTELIRSCGPLEWVFNTPSHHRVHHGINPRYLDKNYAGMFIIWDRLFGTFEPEVEPPVYGTVKPLRSANVAWANVSLMVDMARDTVAAASWRERTLVWIGHPGFRPASLPPYPAPRPVAPGDQPKFDPAPSPAIALYVAAQFVPVVSAMVTVLLLADSDARPLMAVLATQVLAATLAWGGLFERRRWALPLEATRLAVLPLLAAVVAPELALWALAYAGVSGVALVAARR